MGSKQSQPAQEVITPPVIIQPPIQPPIGLPIGPPIVQQPPQSEVVQQQYLGIMTQLKMLEDMIEKEQQQCKQLPPGIAVKMEGLQDNNKNVQPSGTSVHEDSLIRRGLFPSNEPNMEHTPQIVAQRPRMEQVPPVVAQRPRMEQVPPVVAQRPRMEQVPPVVAQRPRMEQVPPAPVLPHIEHEYPSAPATHGAPVARSTPTPSKPPVMFGKPVISESIPQRVKMETKQGIVPSYTNLPLNTIEHFGYGGINWLFIILVIILIFFILQSRKN